MATPPFTAGPAIRTWRGADVFASCMVRVTWDSPFASGGDVATVPDTEVWNGAAGMPEVTEAEVEWDGFVGVVAPEFDLATEPANWARSAEDVPAR